MTLEAVLGIASAGLTLIGAIFGGGILNRFIKHSNELAVTKFIVEQQQKKLEQLVDKVSQLETDSVEVKTKVDQITEHLKKLDMIPELSSRLSAMEGLLTNMSQLVSSIGHRKN